MKRLLAKHAPYPYVSSVSGGASSGTPVCPGQDVGAPRRVVSQHVRGRVRGQCGDGPAVHRSIAG